jgi:hypothetical protein
MLRALRVEIRMPDIPPEYLPLLADLGILQPEHSQWKRLDPLSSKNLWSHHFCPCRTLSMQHRLDLTNTWLGNRKVFIGQCGKCGTVYWRDAVKE